MDIIHKVLSLDEIVNANCDLITEFRYGIEPQHFSLDDRCRWLKQGRVYGKTWRCWNDMPTETERKNTEWRMRLDYQCIKCNSYWCITDCEGNAFHMNYCPECGRKVKWND